MLKTVNLLPAFVASIVVFAANAAWAAPLNPVPLIFKSLPGENGTAFVHGRYYSDWDEDDYEVPGDHYGYDDAPYEYDAPRYRYAPPPPVDYYEPPVYGWLSPPRPQSCGKYRYWAGDHCADARRHPPYVGPRW